MRSSPNLRPNGFPANLLASLLVAFLAWVCSPAVQAAAPRLRVSSNHRFLVNEDGSPFFLNVDTAWTFLSHIPDRAEADAYLDARKAQGYNAILSFMAGWGGRHNSKGGIAAFHHGDLTQPNDAYFATIDVLVRDAADRGMQVMMGPLNLNDNLPSSRDGLPTLREWSSLGTYVGNRYKSFDHIIWVMGGDHDVQQTWGDTGDYTAYIDAMANAIKAVDTGHLMTYHPALDTFVLGAKSWLDFYACQDNRADSAPYTYQRVKPYYECSPTKPAIDLEPGYETGDAMTGVATAPYMVRRNAWWAFLQGALGVTYGGNRATWFIGEHDPNQWRKHVNLAGARQTGLMSSILAGYGWENLVPDSAHALVTSGYDAYGGKDYATAGLSAEGNLGMAYVPTTRALTINMAKFSAPVQAFWVDPSNGAVTKIGRELANRGTRDFATPGPNAAGDSDWLLVLTKT